MERWGGDEIHTVARSTYVAVVTVEVIVLTGGVAIQEHTVLMASGGYEDGSHDGSAGTSRLTKVFFAVGYDVTVVVVPGRCVVLP